MQQISKKDKEFLEYFASYVWWQKKDEVVKKEPFRIIASAMKDANDTSEFIKLCEFSPNLLKETLKKAQADWLDAKSWHFWHIKLYGADSVIPPLPKRAYLNDIVFKTNNEVKLSFFGTLDFVKLANIVQSDDEILKLADLEALLITKLKATCDRAEYKDYKDIIAILKIGQVSLESGLLGVLDYFGDKFPLINIIKGLNYFEDGDLYKLSKDDKFYLCEKVSKLDIAQLNKEIALKKQYLQSPFKDNNIKKVKTNL